MCVFCLPPSHFVSPEPEIEIGRRSQILFKELHFEKGARSLPLSHWFISFLSSRKRKEAGSLLELPVVQRRRRRRRVCVWRERTALPLVPGPTSASTDSYKREKRNFFPSSLFIFFLSSCPFVHLDSGVAARAQIWIGKDRVDRTGRRPAVCCWPIPSTSQPPSFFIFPSLAKSRTIFLFFFFLPQFDGNLAGFIRAMVAPVGESFIFGPYLLSLSQHTASYIDKRFHRKRSGEMWIIDGIFHHRRERGEKDRV